MPALPWDRQADESGEAYAAFLIYRDCGPTRSLDGSYRQSGKGGRKSGARAPDKGAPRAPGTWRGWAKAYSWAQRAREWDARLDQVRMGAREQVAATHAAADQERQEVQRQREDVLLTRIYDKVLAMLEFGLARKITRAGPDGKEITIFEPMRWGMKDAFRGASMLIKLGRLHAQMRTTILEDEQAAAGTDELFVSSSGQLADRLPDGVVPPMPDRCDAPPQIGATIAGGNHGLIQPSAPPRPTTEQLIEENQKRKGKR